MKGLNIFKSKERRFAETVKEKGLTVFVFGQSVYARIFIDKMVELDAQDQVALIYTERPLWLDEYKHLDLVTFEEKRIDKYKKPELYEKIGFELVETAVIFHQDAHLIEAIVTGIRRASKTVRIITLERFQTPFIKYLSSLPQERIAIANDVEAITRTLLNKFDIPISQPYVVQVPVPNRLVNQMVTELNYDSKLLDLLKVVRKNEETHFEYDLLEPIEAGKFQKGDELVFHVLSDEGMGHLINLLRRRE